MAVYYSPETNDVYEAPRKGADDHFEVGFPDGPEYKYHYSFYVFNPKTMEWELSKERVSEDVRKRRDKALRESDYTVLPDVPIKDADKWKEYRKELRDISKQEGFPFDIEWPKRPGDR